MAITMQQLDSFIDVTINRLASEAGSTRSSFYVDLRTFQQRITQNLVAQCTAICASRGLHAERNGDGLVITVDLNLCFLNPNQSILYNTALAYTRATHGNHI
jgi:hypothetical protein